MLFGLPNMCPVARGKRMNPEIEQIAKDTVDTSMKIHMNLGPGLLEIVYEVVLARELQRQGIKRLAN
jgi:hypothetical protein